MDAARLTTKVFAGYGKAATRVAPLIDVYRPVGAGPALALGNKIGELNCVFTIHTSNDFDFHKPSDYDKPLFHALVDPTTLLVGDYLKDPATNLGAMFIASITPAMPPLAVNCNRVINVLQPGPSSVSVGVSSYGGIISQPALGQDNETVLLSQWPASVLLRRVAREQYLPADAGVSMFRVLLPAAGIVIKLGTIIEDDLGNRYAVASAEKQDLGWRLDVLQSAL